MCPRGVTPAPRPPRDPFEWVQWWAPTQSGRLEIDLVDVAPDPVLALFEGLDDRVIGGLEVLGRVAVGRLVAAAYVSAGATEAQVDPATAGFEALLATVGAGRH